MHHFSHAKISSDIEEICRILAKDIRMAKTEVHLRVVVKEGDSYEILLMERNSQ